MTHLLEYHGEEAKFDAATKTVSVPSTGTVNPGALLHLCAWHLSKHTNDFTAALHAAGYEVSHGCCTGCSHKFLTTK